MITKERRKALYSQLAPLIESLETTTLHIKSTSSPTQSILRIGSPIEAFHEMILPVFQALNMRTVSYFGTAEELIDLLKEDVVDVIISSKIFYIAGIEYIPFYEDEYVILSAHIVDKLGTVYQQTVG